MKASVLLENSHSTIDEFLVSQVLKRGLDGRTEKAYRMDLEHLFGWIQEQENRTVNEKAIENYLEYLTKERKLKYSTVTRKYRVFCSYLEYLAKRGNLSGRLSITCPIPAVPEKENTNHELSKAEIDSFFIALKREYENLENQFRKRVCLRDSVMMELLFYHGIEVSELLRLRVSDYNLKTGMLAIRGKREKSRIEYLFSRELREKMKQWIGEHEYFEKDNEYHNVLFLSKTGKPLSMKMVILVFDKYKELAGIEKKATPKDLKCSMKRYAREMMMERCR